MENLVVKLIQNYESQASSRPENLIGFLRATYQLFE